MIDFKKVNPFTVTVSNLVTIYQHDVSDDIKLFLYKIVGYFANVTVAEFRANPVETFKKYNGYTGIPEFQYPIAAQEICKLIKWFDEDWAKANPAPEPMADEFGRDLATREMQIVSLAAFCESYHMYRLQRFVLPGLNMGHLKEARPVAEHVIKNDMYWQFLTAVRRCGQGNYELAANHLHIPWDTGTFSKWTYFTLSNLLDEWDPDELRQLVRKANWSMGKIGDDNISKNLVMNIMHFAVRNGGYTEVLMAATQVRPNP